MKRIYGNLYVALMEFDDQISKAAINRLNLKEREVISLAHILLSKFKQMERRKRNW